jgi:hypothetical protein
MFMLTDRSRILEWQRCPRARYLSYHYDGTGLASTRFAVPLATGAFIHEGLAVLLGGGDVEDAVLVATEKYRAHARSYIGAQGVNDDRYDYLIAEQTALTEALLRVYALKQLPGLLSEFEVVRIEKEYEYEIAPGIVLMVRVDALLKQRATGDLYVMSFKTDKGKDIAGKVAEARHDIQGLTEPLAVEKAGEGQPFGVKMEFLIKGEWKEDERGSGIRLQDSYLVRPWSRPGPVTGTDYAWSYYWECTEPHVQVWKNGRHVTCEGHKTHGLGETWKRVPIWEHMPIKDWIAMLASGQIQPEAGDPLELARIVSTPVPFYRNDSESNSRLVQLAAQEIGVEERLVAVADMQKEGLSLSHALNLAFPQHDRACNHPYSKDDNFPYTCQFYQLCWEGNAEENLRNPYPLGYRRRTPHHEPEARLFQIEGLTPAAVQPHNEMEVD